MAGKLNHTQKVKLARHLRTHDEEIAKRPVFESRGWWLRKVAIEKRVKKQQAIAHYNAEAKRNGESK